MSDRIDEEVLKIPVRVGLRQQGHMETVARMLLDGKTWEEIGAEIHWHPETAKHWWSFEAAAVVAEAYTLRVLAGPICPIDQRYATEHLTLGQTHTFFRSWAEPTPLVKHEYEECSDCDALSSYHEEGVEHCSRCGEYPSECDGMPMMGGVVPSHPKWPEGETWLAERRKR